MLFDLILGSLCVWRITHLLQAEDGPWRMSVRLRRAMGSGFWGELLDCFNCLSLWISAPFAVIMGSGVVEKIFFWLALSAGAILLGAVINRVQGAPAALYREDEEKDDGMLR
ncbi:MAG: DUF1360 domain-containing protein [Syntrophales bacterium]|nr:DUF1360 domain-containing protein [Syntrophales bacterium]